jgi:hypothetical protein
MGKTERRLSTFERAVAHAIGDGRELGSADDPARERFPQLWAWLATVYVGRDSIKNPAYLNVRLGPEGVVVSLIDRDLCTTVEVSCGHLEEALPAIEAALSSSSPPLKSWGRKEPHLRKRRSGG